MPDIVDSKLKFSTQGLAHDYGSGGGVQNTGCGDPEFVNICNIINVPTTETIIKPSAFSITQAFLEDGLLNIEGCTSIGLFVRSIEFGSGPLTQIDLNVLFTDTNFDPSATLPNISAYDLSMLRVGADAEPTLLTARKLKIRFLTESVERGYAFNIPNPGAKYMMFTIQGTGVASGLSTFEMKAGRSFAPSGKGLLL